MSEEQPVEKTESQQHYARMEALRKKHDITWRQVGEIVGLSVSSIMNIKVGHRALNVHAAQRLAEAEALETIAPTKPPKGKPPSAALAASPPTPPSTPAPPRGPDTGREDVFGAPIPPRPSRASTKPESNRDVDAVAAEALDLMAECYRRDVAFLLGIITKDSTVRFSSALYRAPAAAVEDLRTQAGIIDAGVVLEGPAGHVVRKLIGL